MRLITIINSNLIFDKCIHFYTNIVFVLNVYNDDFTELNACK